MPNLKSGRQNWAKGGKEWLSLLLSLLLAFFIWSVHNLSLDYSVYLQYRLEVKANMEGRAMESESEDLLIVRVKASGFYIIQHRFWKNSELSISLEPKYLHPVDGDPNSFSVNCNEIGDKIGMELGTDVLIEYFTTENLVYVFPVINSRKVPVVARTEVLYKSQYMPVGRISLRPDSVLVYGQNKYISNIDSVYTDVISKTRIRRSFQGMAKIIPPKGVRISQNQVYYNQQVDRFIENTVDVPLTVVNVPDGKELLALPSKITLTFRKSFTSMKSFKEEDFEYVVDYYDYINSIDSKVVPRQERIPDGVYSVRINPPFVEVVFIDK